MLVHTTTRKHWAITSKEKGASCPACEATHIRPCKDLPWTTVHIERVTNMGHAVKQIDLPIHRAKIPAGPLAELRRRMSQ